MKRAFSYSGQNSVPMPKGWQRSGDQYLGRQRQVPQNMLSELQVAFFEMASLNLQLANEGLNVDNEALDLLEKVLSEV